jgi:hypothetical protein
MKHLSVKLENVTRAQPGVKKGKLILCHYSKKITRELRMEAM